jgi:hypothetical protein
VTKAEHSTESPTPLHFGALHRKYLWVLSTCKETHNFVGRHRSAQEKTLHLVALEQPEQIQLFLGLDAFRNYFEAERMGERNDGRYDGPVLRIRAHAEHDAAAMTIDYALNGGEADSRTGKLIYSVQSLERAEQLIGVCHIEASAVVAYKQYGSFALARHAELDEWLD